MEDRQSLATEARTKWTKPKIDTIKLGRLRKKTNEGSFCPMTMSVELDQDPENMGGRKRAEKM